MKDSTKDQATGKLHEAKGAVKEKIGELTNNPDLQDEGTAEKVGGKVQKKVGEIKKVLGA
ncbi:MAG: CsbD family protein [Acidobacteriota bacterium]